MDELEEDKQREWALEQAGIEHRRNMRSINNQHRIHLQAVNDQYEEQLEAHTESPA